MSQSLFKDYYVYKIFEQSFFDDVSDQTFARRLQKKERSQNLFFIFDLSALNSLNPDQIHVLKEFFAKSVATTFCINPYLYPFFSQFIEKTIHLVIQNTQQLEIYQTMTPFGFASVTLHPLSKSCFANFLKFTRAHSDIKFYWQFSCADKLIENTILIKDIGKVLHSQTLLKSPISFFNNTMDHTYELESLNDLTWQFQTPKKNILLSIVIPTFNNALFLSNVLHHLFSQNTSTQNYEVIVVDDGSHDHSKDIIYSIFYSRKDKINLKYIYWPKSHPEKGEQYFFRAGLARNLGVFFSQGAQLFFLDSDMLVPFDFVENVLYEFEYGQVLQFVRYHIEQNLSLKNPDYHHVNLVTDTYIEEKNYWSNLFQVKDWNQLNDRWKFVCTYALGLSRQDFYDCGRFKRHFMSYGFEDTDLGFRLYKKNKSFKLLRKPLLHLTNYNLQQYQNSKIKRNSLLQKTARLLFLDHLDSEIYKNLEFYYQMEVPE